MKKIQHESNSNLCVRFTVINDPRVETIELTCSMFLVIIHSKMVVRFLNFTASEPNRQVTKELERQLFSLSSKGYTIE